MSGKLSKPQDFSTQSSSESPRVWEPRVRDWPTKPGSENRVRLIFHGLMGFCCNYEDRDGTACQIGFHKGNSKHPHRLRIEAFDSGCEPNKLPDATPSDVGINVYHPNESIFPGLGFYQPTDVSQRQDLDDDDFRWIVDFESDYLYGKYLSGPKRLKKKANIYKPKLTLYKGLFYTVHKTKSTFRVQTRDGDPNYVTNLGPVADYIAADIYVEPHTVVGLVIDGEEYPVVAPGEIVFYNDCYDPDTNDPCEFNPYDLEDKENRNDFYVNYSAFHLDGLREYELFLVNGEKSEFEICGSRLTDEAPCAGSGFGGGGILP